MRYSPTCISLVHYISRKIPEIAPRCLSIAFSLIIVLSLFISVLGTPPQKDEELTLPLAVDIALRSNPLTRMTIAGQEIAAAQMNQARAARMPLIQIQETFVRSNNPVFVFGSLLEQGRFGMENFSPQSLNAPKSFTNFRSSISFRLPLFDQREASSKIVQARILQEQANMQEDLIFQQIRFEVIKSYFGVLVAEAKKEVADESVKMAEADIARIQALYDQGQVVISDLLAMKVQLSDFRQQQIQAAGELVIAFAALNVALGLPLDSSHKISARLIDRRFALPTQPELLEIALQHRPDYRQTLHTVTSRDQGIRAIKGQSLPRLDLFGNFGNSGNRLFNGSTDYTFGLTVTFNLIDQGRQARLREATAARSMAEAERQHKEDLIKLDVVMAYQNCLAAAEKLKVSNEALQQAKETLRIVETRHEVGLSTITEVLRSQTTLVRTRLNLLGARYDYLVGYAQTMLVSGQLNDLHPFID